MTGARWIVFALLLCSCGRRPVDPASNESVDAMPERPLPVSAMRVEWGDPVLPPRVAAGSTFQATIGIRNAGSHVWPSTTAQNGGRYAVRFSHRWCGADGTGCSEFRERHEIGAPLPAGAWTNLIVSLRAPSQPGTYELQFDGLQELVAWFSSQGSRILKVPVRVE